MVRSTLLVGLVLAAFVGLASRPRADIPPPYEPFGIGAVLSEHEPFPTLVDIKRGGPAEIAGLIAGDEVIALDGSYAKSGAPFYFFARKLQGMKNSGVQLIVLRAGHTVLVVNAKRTYRLR